MMIATIGAAIVDIVLAQAKPMLGAKQDVDHIGLYAGGGAVNAALNFASLGASGVAVYASVGEDLEAGLIRSLLHTNGVRPVFAAHALPTGKAVVMVDDQGAARAYAQRGASAWVGETGFDGLEQFDLLYVTGLSLESQACLVEALQRRGRRGQKLVVTPGARQLASPKQLLPLWQMADLFCVNASEAAALCGTALADDAIIEPAQARELAAGLGRAPGQAILLTMGRAGALFYDGTNSWHKPAKEVAVVSTIGAGDAFASAFVHSWAGGQAPEQALADASASAARIIGVIPANGAGPLRPAIGLHS